jgi:hypothetical protein
MRVLVATLLLLVSILPAYASPPTRGSVGSFNEVIICNEHEQLVKIVGADEPSLQYAAYRTELDAANLPTCFVGSFANVEVRNVTAIGRMQQGTSYVLAWSVEVCRGQWRRWVLYVAYPPQT